MKEINIEDMFRMNLNNYFCELKYDGVRTYLIKKNGRIKLINKEGRDITNRIIELKNEDMPNDTILDGELVVFRNGKPIFDNIQKRVHNENPFKVKLYAKNMPITYMVFDILMLKGELLTEKPIEYRKNELIKHIKESEHLKIVEVHFNAKELWNYVVKNDLEGIILKRKFSKYSEDFWIKVKNKKVDDVYITDYEETPTGIVVISNDGHRITINGKQAERIKKMIPTRIRVEFLEKTKNGKFRQPVFKSI